VNNKYIFIIFIFLLAGKGNRAKKTWNSRMQRQTPDCNDKDEATLRIRDQMGPQVTSK
jgi:hypothetical protein